MHTSAPRILASVSGCYHYAVAAGSLFALLGDWINVGRNADLVVLLLPSASAVQLISCARMPVKCMYLNYCRFSDIDLLLCFYFVLLLSIAVHLELVTAKSKLPAAALACFEYKTSKSRCATPCRP